MHIPQDDTQLDGVDRLWTLNQIGCALSSTLDLPELYDTIYGQIAQVMDATHFFIAFEHPSAEGIDIPYLREYGTLITDAYVEAIDTITGLVIDRGIALLFNTLDEYRTFNMENGLNDVVLGGSDAEADPQSLIFVPLTASGRTVGALSVQSPHAHAYVEQDVQMLTVVASQATVAIENARLYARSVADTTRMEALLRVAELVNSTLDLEGVLDAILIGIRDVIPYWLAAVLLPDPTRSFLEVAGTVGPDAERWKRTVTIPITEGVTGRVFQTSQSLMLSDVREFPGYIGSGAELLSELAVPLTRGQDVIGVLNLERQERAAFSEADRELLSLFATQAAIAIENARLYADQQRRVVELQTIQTIVQGLAPLYNVLDIAAVIDRILKTLIDYNVCGLFRLDDSGTRLVPIMFEGSAFPFMYIQWGEGLTGWVAQHGCPALVPDSRDDARVAPIPGRAPSVESLVSVPLIYEGRVRGVITLSKLGTSQFNTGDLRLLEIVAAQTALALDRARLLDELRTDAITDPVTRLYNRRYLLDRLAEEQSRAARNRHPLCALMLDIDKFKRVNDRWGHDAGDVVLQELASLIRGVVRAEDIVARYGGEEFCVLLPEIGLEQAAQVAERLRVMVERQRLAVLGGGERITVSVGLAMREGDDEGVGLFTRADLAMYQVKHAGGNRVCIAQGAEFRLERDEPRPDAAAG